MGSWSSSAQLITMKFLVLATCLSLSTAGNLYGYGGYGYGGAGIATSAIAAPAIAAPAIAAPAINGYAAGYGYGGPLNLNAQLVAHPNGAVVPADEPAVAAARASHFAAGGGRAAPIVAAPAIGANAAGYGYAGPLNLNAQLVAHPNGAVVPADEPAVAAARANHFAAGGRRAAPIVAAPA